MNRHALEVLEFFRVLERVGTRATSAMGREAVLSLVPSAEVEAPRRELERVAATLRFLEARPGWAPPPVPDARRALKRLALEGAVLEGIELALLGALLVSTRLLRESLEEAEEAEEAEEVEEAKEAGEGNGASARHGAEAVEEEDVESGGAGGGALADVVRRLHPHREPEKAIQRAVDPDGHLLDEASPTLRGIRGRLRRASARIVEQLEAHLRTLPVRWLVPDASVTIRNGRYVIPVRKEGRREVGGVVHGESATGATLFIEPPLAIRLANDLQEMEREEAREVQRILREHTERLRPLARELEASQRALVDFDTLYARAKAARDWQATVPELLPTGSGELAIVRGRHPLLLERHDDGVVPFDVALDAGERALVVSGPNTGGKSVFLKAVGLVSALAQSGVVPPVGPGTRLPVFTGIFADIGDEQSIAESLSTFSAHLANMREIVDEAEAGSLVLMDEMGTGTDPTEGAALARALLELLVERGAVSVVTSHLGALKRLDRAGSGIVNASLQFDPDRLEPTYVFQKGRPGRSYGLAIARRLGFPESVLRRAESHMPRDEVSVEALLAKLERKEKEAQELVQTLARERDEAVRLRAELQAREAELRERERAAERESREEAARRLLDARAEVEAAIREVREGDGGESLETRERRARQRVEQAVREQRDAAQGMDGPDGEASPLPSFQAGDRVRVLGSGARGTVVEVRDRRAVVEASGLRMRLPLEELAPVEGAAGGRAAGTAGETRSGAARSRGTGPATVGEREEDPKPAGAGGGWSGPEPDASVEADLRGLRVDEVDHALARALDAAIVGGLPELRIIHGKGTGALRARVTELLRMDQRIRDFRPGGAGEGGAGVTVVDLT